jgi:glycosyltransferase involved in cell wall biosynthesis
MTKRLLLIAHFFPPYNPTESRRALVIARAAAKDGWWVDVIAPWAPNFHSSGEVPDWPHYFSDPNRVKVCRTPGGLYEGAPFVSKTFNWLLSHIKTTWFGSRLQKLSNFPDRCASWLYFLIPRAVWLTFRNHPDIILTSSYPYTAHIAGLIVSSLFHLPWIVDTRDGWAVDDSEQFVQIEPSLRLRKWHRSLLSIVVKRATQIWSITPGIRDATAHLFQDQDPHKFVAIVQGYELDECSEHAQAHKHPCVAENGSDFVLGYAGRFRPDLTPAEPILKALKRLKEFKPDLYSCTKLRVWGYTTGYYHKYLSELAHSYGVEQSITTCESLPEHELISALRECDALLLTTGSSNWTQKRLTTKLFVYLASHRPILAICESTSDIARLIDQTHVGLTISPSDPVMIAGVLENWVLTRSETERLVYGPDLQILEQYSLQKGVMPLIAKKLTEASCFRPVRLRITRP